MKYCSNCGVENDNNSEMCLKCGGLLFINKQLYISNKPSIFISIISFIFPLLGFIIASFCNDSIKRKRYRNFAFAGSLFYLILTLIYKCIEEQEYNKAVNEFLEEIYRRNN